MAMAENALARWAEPDGTDDQSTRALSRRAALDMPWPRPVLRLVTPSEPAPRAAATARATGAWSRQPGASSHEDRSHGAVEVPRGIDVHERRAQRARTRRRRRHVVVGAAAAVMVALLALPLSALGARPAPGVTSGAVAARTTAATVYVVQPGETLWEVATKLDGGGDPRALAEAIARETGSSTVVAGERVPVP